MQVLVGHAHSREVARTVAEDFQVLSADAYEQFVSNTALSIVDGNVDDIETAVNALNDFDPATTLFVDDNCRVLDAALAFGIRGVIEVTCPDTRMAVKEPGTHRGVRRVASLI